jgi:outer membrane protein assembly factor BamD
MVKSKTFEEFEIMFKKFIIFIAILVFTGCSDKNRDYNQVAEYWYDKIVKSISIGELDKAGDYLTSLISEHVKSPHIKDALLLIAQAHIKNDEHLLANFYLDQYIKKYASTSEIEYAKFLKIKSFYLSLKYQNRDQGLIQQALADSQKFKDKYPNSKYMPMLDTIVTNLNLSKDMLNHSIVTLYNKLDKPDAAEVYKARIDTDVNLTNINDPEVFIIRRIFE